MFITRECDYAVRVIRALAGESRLSVSEICEKESITAPFAYKILKKLQEAGACKGVPGSTWRLCAELWTGGDHSL